MRTYDPRPGDTIANANLSRFVPGSRIFEGVTGLTFVGCNLTNCVVPDDAKVIDCNVTQVSFCTHLHPELVERGVTPCAEDCEHRVGTEKQLVEVGAEEYRQAKRGAKQATVQDVKDADGIIERQVFKVERYAYEDKVQPRTKPISEPVKEVR